MSNKSLNLILSTCVFVLGFSTSAFAIGLSTKIQFFNKDLGGSLSQASVALFGKQIVVQVSGLQPGKTYLLSAAMPFGNKSYHSYANFQSDNSGIIQTDTAVPQDGTYPRVDSDGLFWSMAAAPEDTTLTPNSYTFVVKDAGQIIMSKKLPKTYFAPGVRTVSLEGTGLVGTLYLPAKELGPRPAVIAFSGSEGGAETGTFKALQLANNGYVALGLAYFNAPGVPKDLANIPIEYFESAIKYLQGRIEVKSDQIAVLGVSRGGELVFLLGSLLPQITAVIAQVPGPIAFPGNAEDDSMVPAWTYRGVAFPYLPFVGYFTKTTLPDGREVSVNRSAFEEALRNTQAVEKAFIPIEKINGPILMLASDDDQVWPSCVLVDMAVKRLKEKKHAFNDHSVCYSNAGHGVGNIPGIPATDTVIYHPLLKAQMALGGNPADNAGATRDSWDRIFQFLADTFN